jgi:hypothetical protein
VAFLRFIFPGLERYVAYFDRERDPEGSGLYDIENHYETGQEYMHRYLAVSEGADRENWGGVFRLKGVDVTVYLYELKKTLAWMAGHLQMEREIVEAFHTGAEKTRRAILEQMWDPELEMFFDVDPATHHRTLVKALTCFYPYMTDIVSERHLAGLKRHLFNPKEFWTPFPCPSSSADDPYFSAEGEWKGERKNCPWNGRVWPMTNSHIATVLALCAVRFDDAELRRRSSAFIGKFVGMMFSGPRAPNCYEHYNPVTGEPSLYRGVNDYQHSWVNDLILGTIAGVRVENGEIVVQPSGVTWCEVRNLVIRGMDVRIRKDRSGLRVRCNGRNLPPESGGRVTIKAAGV